MEQTTILNDTAANFTPTCRYLPTSLWRLFVVVIVSVSIINTSNCWADCANPVAPIKAGQVATCDGFLFSDEAEKQAEQYRSDADYYKKLSDKLQEKSDLDDKQSDVLNKRLQLYMNESDQLAKNQASRDNTEELYRFAYFAAGVLVTGLIVRNLRP